MIGLLPALVASRARGATDPVSVATTAAFAALVLAAVAFGWVRYRDDIHASMSQVPGSKP